MSVFLGLGSVMGGEMKGNGCLFSVVSHDLVGFKAFTDAADMQVPVS